LTESEISKDIQDYLKDCGFTWFWRNQVYKGRVKSGAYLHTGKAGISDIILIAFDRTIFIELKKSGGKQSDEQKEFEAHCLLNKQDYFLIESVEELKIKLMELKE